MIGPRSLLVAVLLSAAVFSGCISDGSEATSADPGDAPISDGGLPDDGVPVLTIPEGAWDPSYEGLWYEAGSFDVPVSGTLRIHNGDSEFHRVLGSLQEPSFEPEWLDTYDGHHGPEEGGHEDAEGGHADGGGHDDGAASIFDVELEPGEWQDVTIAEEGAILLHCHPHPWMEGLLNASHLEPEDHSVVVNSLVVTGEASGTVRMGHGNESLVELPLNLTAANLVALNATLVWDDSEDDGPLGHDGNEPDTFHFALMSPNGDHVVEDTVTAREGEIVLLFEAPIEWPGVLEVKDHWEGAALLASMATTDVSGPWILHVELDAAPGYPGTGDGSDSHDASFVPGADGVQSWNLTFEAVHEWAAIGGAPTEAKVVLDLAGAEDDHEH